MYSQLHREVVSWGKQPHVKKIVKILYQNFILSNIYVGLNSSRKNSSVLCIYLPSKFCISDLVFTKKQERKGRKKENRSPWLDASQVERM